MHLGSHIFVIASEGFHFTKFGSSVNGKFVQQHQKLRLLLRFWGGGVIEIKAFASAVRGQGVNYF